jgi:hypothetical protein
MKKKLIELSLGRRIELTREIVSPIFNLSVVTISALPLKESS